MEILLDENKLVLAFAVIGELDDSAQHYSGVIPENFYEDFKPKFFMLKDELIVENPDYVAPSDTPPVNSPTSVQEAINKLGEVTAKIADDDNQIKSALNKLGLAVADLQQTKEVK